MNKFRFTVNALAIAIFAITFAATARAQATRTWVSGVGDDANPCSRTAPCKTFAGSISKTATGGYIDCLDPGGFGAVTITKSITIQCDEEIGHILVSGTNAIVISAPANSVVTLRGLSIEGIGTGLAAIKWIGTSGTLHVQECVIHDFTGSGIDFAPNGAGTANLFVSDEVLIHDNNGTDNTQAGILIRPAGGASANVTINGVHMKHNQNGIFMDGSGGGGASNLVVQSSELSGNSNTGIAVASSGPAFSATVANSLINLNINVGAAVNGANATLRLGGNIIGHNVTGVSNVGGTLQSFKNNSFSGNLSDGAVPIPVVTPNGGGQ